MLSDCHMHSHHSGDSEAPMKDMIEQSIALNFKTICFTEHMDMDFVESPGVTKETFLLDVNSYRKELMELKDFYSSKIKVIFGVEVGLQPHIVKENSTFVKENNFDFVIGSSHLCNKKDPYLASFFENRSDEEGYREYFESEYDNILVNDCFDVYGHLDYVVRYGASKDTNYSYNKYSDIFDMILKALIERQKGIEVNTSGLAKGLRSFHPSIDVLKRYKELGGEILTVGSDAHKPEAIGYAFDKTCELIKECGFNYITVFEKQTPSFVKI
ncbi:MAG: histidinol-phosphatase HisJ family protein [Lachnospiraceae bacterium]|nr:histidinol-phosphatase HisJ family protein [Lachnospiraceae bacterium]